MRYVFGDCVLDTQRYVLHRAGQPVRLRPKVFQLLVYLLIHRERVISKQELSEQVWKGQAVSDATLESTLAAVRRAGPPLYPNIPWPWVSLCDARGGVR